MGPSQRAAVPTFRPPHRGCSERRGRNLGANDYITKPIDFDILEATINVRLTGRHETWPKLARLNDCEAEAITWVVRGKTSAQIAKLPKCSTCQNRPSILILTMLA
jgi:DNA-binding response OmpR family regulator